jgi:hypothetical protein
VEKNPLLVDRQETFRTYNPRPLVMALWSLIDQPIVAQTSVRPIEPTARKYRKKLAGNGSVRVLSLRQKASGGGGGNSSPRVWNHRWVVRGFWRNQHYGPGGKEVKRVWIDSYVKGPEGAPLVIPPTVYKV